MTPLTPEERWNEHKGWQAGEAETRAELARREGRRFASSNEAVRALLDDSASYTSTATPRSGDVYDGASPRPRPRAARPVASRGARSTLTIITVVALFWVAALFAVVGLALASSPDSARAVVPLTLAAMLGYCVIVAIKGDE